MKELMYLIERAYVSGSSLMCLIERTYVSDLNSSLVVSKGGLRPPLF